MPHFREEPWRRWHEECHVIGSMMTAAETSLRKEEHIRICLEKDVAFKKSNGFEKYDFEHRALPELSLSEIDTASDFLTRRFDWPFFIEPLTGGAPGTERINRNLARAAESFGIGMGVGSQRAMLEDSRLTYTYQVRDVAPNILLLGNIGATQLSELDVPQIIAMVREIEADGLVIHLNAAQELCQPGGNTDWRHIIVNIKRVCENTDFPVLVKETGCGISGDIGRMIEKGGAACLDIAGAGGTSMTRVEYLRGGQSAKAFFEWGIPTAESLRQCREAVKIPLIASGGMRTGLECAKALALGAVLVGFALPMLKAAMDSHDAVIETLTDIGSALKRTMLLLGARNIQELRKAKLIRVADCSDQQPK